MTADREVKVCEHCGKEYRRGKLSRSQWETRRFCSPKCTASLVRGKSEIRPDEATLRDLYEVQRFTTRQIGERYGVAHITVRRWLGFYGIGVRASSNGLLYRGVTPPTADELNRMVHEEHLSYEQIAAKYGVDLTAVPYWLKKHGIPRPKGWITRRKGHIPVLPDADTLRRLYRKHKNLKVIGEMFGVGGKIIADLCDRYGIDKRRTSPPDADLLESLYTSGKTIEQIGQQLGYSGSGIAGLLKDYGIERRPAGFNGGRRYTCDNGELVLSVYEQRVCNWLNTNHLGYTYEPTLPFGHRCRANFFVNGWYIEVWGVTGPHYPIYKARKERKIQLYRSHGLPLIEIPRKAFYDDSLEKRLAQCFSPVPRWLPFS